MKELPDGKHRVTKIHLRGDWLNLGKEVKSGLPAMFPPLPKGESANRLGLAKWLVSPENPLTARVAVNRFWEQIFGTGPRRHAGRFRHSQQAAAPSRPARLAGGRLHRRIALGREEAAQGDGHFRDVSAIVDGDAGVAGTRSGQSPVRSRPALRSSGGGRSAIRRCSSAGCSARRCTAPRSVRRNRRIGLNAAFGPGTDWTTSSGEDKYRRGLYTYWRRTTPYPSMVTFDAPNRNVCTVNRPRTQHAVASPGDARTIPFTSKPPRPWLAAW